MPQSLRVLHYLMIEALNSKDFIAYHISDEPVNNGLVKTRMYYKNRISASSKKRYFS
jgi:hypothetical protein